MTISIGLAVWDADTEGEAVLGAAMQAELAARLIEQADMALLGAKTAGRNTVTLGRSAA